MDNILTLPPPGQLSLLVAPWHIGRKALMAAIVRLALGAPVHILDGGNCLEPYQMARALRRKTPQVEQILTAHVLLSRAFTCYQVRALLDRLPESGAPVIALELLATFYDDSVRLPEAVRLLQACTARLRRLSRLAPAVISVSPQRPEQAGRGVLLELLSSAVDQVLIWEAPSPVQQLCLF